MRPSRVFVVASRNHGGERVTKQLDKIWTKYTGNPPPYGLRDPAIDEKRVLFVCNVDRIATFGKP